MFAWFPPATSNALTAPLACRKRCNSGPTPWRSPPSDEGCCSVDVAMSTRAYEERPPRKPQDNLVWVRVRGIRVGLGLEGRARRDG